MPAFQLETIDPAARSANLVADDLAAIDEARAAGYAKGFQDGVAAATHGIEAERTALLAALSEAVNDQRFDIERANATIQASLAELVRKIGVAVTGALAASAFEDQVVTRVRQVVAEAQAGDLTVFLPEDRVADATALLGDVADQLQIEAAPHLQGQVAELRWANGADRIDLERAERDIVAAVIDYCDVQKGAVDDRRNRAG